MIIHKIKGMYTYFADLYIILWHLVYFAFFDTRRLLGLYLQRGDTLCF